MAATTVTEDSVSGLAITSLVLGILTLLAFRIPLLPLLPGLLAIIFGIIGIRMASRGTASGRGMAVAGIICAALGMIPSLIMVASFISGFLIGVSGI